MDHAQLLQALPPELFTLIYDYTFTSSDTLQTISESYKPPPQLQVDTISRAAFAKSYYANTIYIEPGNHDTTAAKWLSSLSRSHREMLQRVVVPKVFAYDKSCDCFVPERAQSTLADHRVRDWFHYLKSKDVDLPVQSLYVSIFGKLWSYDSHRQLRVTPGAEYVYECKSHLYRKDVVASVDLGCLIQ